MGYTPFKMKGPSLYRTPVKDDGQDKARKNVELMDKESDKLKTNLSKHVKKQSIPTVTPDEKKVDNKKTNTKKVDDKTTKLMKTIEDSVDAADDKKRRKRIAEIDAMKEWWSKKDERKKKTDERDRKEKEKREREKKQEDSWRNFGKPDWMKNK